MDILGWDELGQIFRAGRSHEELKAGEAEGVGWHMLALNNCAHAETEN